MKKILKILHLQRRKWENDSRNALSWSFYCVNDNKPMDIKCFQFMRCIFCYVNLVLITTVKTQARKGLILYNNANEITALNEHVYANHCMIIKLFEEEVNISLKEPNEREFVNKRPHVNGNIIFLKICCQRFL
jgi:hypothetical protein